jgi:hypothetical protein
MSDKGPNPVRELFQEGLASHWIGLGLTSSLVGIVVGAVSTAEGWYPVSIAIWAVSVPVFAVSVLQAWFGRPLRDLQGYFNTTVHALVGYTVDHAVGRYLSEELGTNEATAKKVLQLCRPIVRRTLSAQLSKPFTARGLQLKYTVDRIEDNEFGCGSELIRVQWEHAWQLRASVPKPDLRDLMPPVFVCDDSALAIREIADLADAGVIDLLWPIPFEWVKRNRDAKLAGQLRKWRWYSVQELWVNQRDVADCLTTSSKWHEIERVLSAACERRGSHLSAKALRAFKSKCVFASYLKNELGDDGIVNAVQTTNDYQIDILLKSSYWVWVKGPVPGQVLYRYEVAFDGPAFVSSIQFGLATREDNTPIPSQQAIFGRWSLIPPAIRAASPLLDYAPTKRIDEQSLRWPVLEGENTPFLPGHGVTFMWLDSREPTGGSSTAVAGPGTH